MWGEPADRNQKHGIGPILGVYTLWYWLAFISLFCSIFASVIPAKATSGLSAVHMSCLKRSQALVYRV